MVSGSQREAGRSRLPVWEACHARIRNGGRLKRPSLIIDPDI